LEMLHRRKPYLSTLHLGLQSPCTTIVAAASFTQLRELALSFTHDSRLDAVDILQIAQQFPNLIEINLAEQGPRPQVTGLDDNMVVDIIARHLLLVLHIALKVETAEPLTLRSIRSLGRHCPELTMINVSSITIDWDASDTVHEAGEVISTEIWSVDIALHEDQPSLPYNDGYDDNQEDSNRIDQLAASFSHLFPQLQYFNLTGGGEGESQFYERVRDHIVGYTEEYACPYCAAVTP
jgi:hypothetical protein